MPHLVTTEDGSEFMWWSREDGASLELEVLHKLREDGVIENIIYDAPFIKIDGQWLTSDGKPPGRLAIADRESWRKLQDR